MSLGFALVCILGAMLARLFFGQIASFPALAKDSGNQEIKQQIQANLTNTVGALALPDGTRNLYGTHSAKLNATAESISKAFIQHHYAPSNFPIRLDVSKYSLGVAFQAAAWNIIADRKGTNDEDGIIVVGAHYDTMPASADWTGTKLRAFAPDQLGTPGANDNASGVAALLEIARIISTESTKRTVRFVAFTNEEPPFFQKTDAMGSYLYARACAAAKLKIKAMIALDALGIYDPKNTHSRKRPWFKDLLASAWGLPDESNYVAFMSNWNQGSGSLAKDWARVFATLSSMPVRTSSLPFVSGEYFAWSDDWSFTQNGYPAFTVTDTAFYRSARYHELDDTFTNLTEADFKGLTEVVYGLSKTVLEMANR